MALWMGKKRRRGMRKRSTAVLEARTGARESACGTAPGMTCAAGGSPLRPLHPESQCASLLHGAHACWCMLMLYAGRCMSGVCCKLYIWMSTPPTAPPKQWSRARCRFTTLGACGEHVHISAHSHQPSLLSPLQASTLRLRRCRRCRLRTLSIRRVNTSWSMPRIACRQSSTPAASGASAGPTGALRPTRAPAHPLE